MLGHRVDGLCGNCQQILVCEYVTECNVAPPGVCKLNKQALAVDFGYVVIGKLNSGVLYYAHDILTRNWYQKL